MFPLFVAIAVTHSHPSLNQAMASISNLSGSYLVTDLECATPRPGYILEIEADLALENPALNEEKVNRTVRVLSKSAPTSPYKFECRVEYRGNWQSVEGKTVGLLEQTSCDCGALKPEDAQALCFYSDVYLVEPEGTVSEVVVSENGEQLTSQALRTLERPLPGCGTSLPKLSWSK